MTGSFLKFRLFGEEFDFQKNTSVAYWQESIPFAGDYLPQFQFYNASSSTTAGYPIFELLKLSEEAMNDGRIVITKTYPLTAAWLKLTYSEESQRLLCYNDEDQAFTGVQENGVYQLRVSLNAEDIWTSEPFCKRDVTEVSPDVAKITMDMSTPSTAGINVTFTGNLYIDWKEGGGKVAFTSGVELTHTYSASNTYIAEISGDLENITDFIADNSKITTITDFKTGLLTNLRLDNNLLTGTLDLSNVPISGVFLVYLNANLTGITFASSGNGIVTDFQAQTCDLTGTLNLSNVPISGALQVSVNPNMTGITFASSGNGTVTSFRAYSCDLTGALDISNVPISGVFFVYLNANLTGITFASSGSNVTSFRAYSCDLTGALDISNVPISGVFLVYSNANLTGITFASSGNAILTSFQAQTCDLTGTLNLSNVPISTLFYTNSNPNLTGITFASSGNAIVTDFRAHSCNLTGTPDLSNVPISGLFFVSVNANLTGITFASSGNGIVTGFQAQTCDLTNIDYSVFSTSNNIYIYFDDNSLTATEHDNQLINLDATGWTGGDLDILTGNTARTSASDTAYNNLIANCWTIT